MVDLRVKKQVFARDSITEVDEVTFESAIDMYALMVKKLDHEKDSIN